MSPSCKASSFFITVREDPERNSFPFFYFLFLVFELVTEKRKKAVAMWSAQPKGNVFLLSGLYLELSLGKNTVT